MKNSEGSSLAGLRAEFTYARFLKSLRRLQPVQRREVLHVLIERVGVDPESGTLRVTFHEPAPPPGPEQTKEAAP